MVIAFVAIATFLMSKQLNDAVSSVAAQAANSGMGTEFPGVTTIYPFDFRKFEARHISTRRVDLDDHARLARHPQGRDAHPHRHRPQPTPKSPHPP
ncbi:MAG: hypothetical protein OSA48_11020, partial [Akkermansiaceae bacterium]|nr:hypothetical protein [Akkermansiaceae bacterium]